MYSIFVNYGLMLFQTWESIFIKVIIN